MARNPALETKVKALKGKLLTNRDYMRLIETENVSGVIDYLKNNTYFKDNLSDISENESRTVLEEQFNHVVLDNSRKILYFVRTEEKDFINLVIQHINMNSLLVVLRALVNQQAPGALINHLAFSESLAEKDFEEIIKSGSWEDFKHSLYGTIFYRSVEPFDHVDVTNLFEVEKAIERAYYDLLYRYIGKNTSTNKRLIKCLRTEIDLLNLMWIYRAKKFYHYTSDQIIPYIYRGGLRVSEDALTNLAQTETYEELMQKLLKFQDYNFLFDHSKKDLDLHMYRRFRRFLYYQFKELFFFGNAISSAYAYLQLLDDEISDIISIIEAKRYHLSNQETIEYLVRDL